MQTSEHRVVDNPAGLSDELLTHWAGEREYWTAQLERWCCEHHGFGLHAIQTDDSTVPTPDLIGEVQSASKAHPDAYFGSGCRGALMYFEALHDHGFDAASFDRILEFGVGFGRLLRHYWSFKAELFGCDVTPSTIKFCQRVFGDRVSTALTGVSPPLPYVDGAFDFVFANSVFTHIRLADTACWVKEFARIIAPGGAAIVSTFEPNSQMVHFSERDFDRQVRATGTVAWGNESVRERYQYCDDRTLRAIWSGSFEVLEIRTHFKEQRHVILRRKSGG